MTEVRDLIVYTVQFEGDSKTFLLSVRTRTNMAVGAIVDVNLSTESLEVFGQRLRPQPHWITCEVLANTPETRAGVVHVKRTGP